jgi:hypothetical protein
MMLPMASSLSAEWDGMEGHARQRDAHSPDHWSRDFRASPLPADYRRLPGDPGPLGVPATLAVLVAAVRATSLQRLYPFMSLCRFCLSDGPEFWEGRGQVAPAFVAYDRSGYTVFSGGPYDDPGDGPDMDWAGTRGTVTLKTPDETAAAAELERLLQGWPEAS